jgi:hypothetical protein
MTRLTFESDKFNDYSDYERKIQFSSKQTSRRFASSIGIDRSRIITWLSYRNVQKMWQNRLQVFKWPWSWAKVLFIYQFSQRKAKNALCAKGIPESGGREVGKFSANKTDVGRDLRIESGVIEKTRRSLNASDLCSGFVRSLGVGGYVPVAYSYGKHVGRLSFRISGGR